MKTLHNARIYTLDPNLPIASTLVIDHGKVIFVGEQSVASLPENAEYIDMNGRVILPGLTDAHIHLQTYALGLKKVNCETKTLSECLRRIKERVRETPPGDWVLGHGWNQNVWKPPSFPSKSDLDKIAPNNPVYLTAKSLHAAWVNSAALKVAKITANTPDPADGKIMHDEHGQPTGILLEWAYFLVRDILPKPSIAEIALAIEESQPNLWQMGLTSVHDFDWHPCFPALQLLHAQKRLHLRVTKNILADQLPDAIKLGLRSGFGDEWLRIGGIKTFMDGALGPGTAAMLEPYLNQPENKGMLIMDGEELFDLAKQAAENGLSMTVHAIGDRANNETLNAFARLREYERANNLPPLRHRIEHVQLLHPNDKNRLAELDVIASMQPIHATSDMDMADEFWGERAALSYACRTQLDAGAKLAFGSDAPVESPNPFFGLHAAVTRQRADGSPSPQGWRGEQRLSLEEALAGFTTGPAYAAGMEDRLGQLRAGFLADLIVLDEDLFSIEPNELQNIKPVATMIGGEWVWQAYQEERIYD
mgnify:CR=1 FL=1